MVCTLICRLGSFALVNSKCPGSLDPWRLFWHRPCYSGVCGLPISISNQEFLRLMIAQSAGVGAQSGMLPLSLFLYLSVKVKTDPGDLFFFYLNFDAFFFFFFCPNLLRMKRKAAVLARLLCLLTREDSASENFPDWIWIRVCWCSRLSFCKTIILSISRTGGG